MQRDVLKSASAALAAVAIQSSVDEWAFPEWIVKHITVKHAGRQYPYSFAGFEPYLEIAKNLHNHDENWFLKGTQIGFSTLMIGWNLYLPKWKGLDCGYALPDKVNIKPFMKTRFGKEQIQVSSVLGQYYEEHETELFYSAGQNYVYFLGANVITDTMTRPMEQLSLDEVTVMDKDMIELIQERLDAASFGQVNGFAREMYPGGPADAGYQSGSQNRYMFICPHCKYEQNLEDIFYTSSINHEPLPGCVKKVGNDWQIACVKCGRTYPREGNGRWVAQFPNRDINSYRLPQLIFPGMNLNKVMRRWEKSATKKSKRAKLHSSMLGIPDAGDLQRITIDTLRQLKRNYSMQDRADWSVGGMDMGDICYIYFCDFVDDILRVIWWQELDSDCVEEKASELIERMNCALFVMDGMPLTTTARKIAYRFPDIVYLNYYRGNELTEKDADHLGQEYKTLTQDREQALDDYCDLFNPTRPAIIFPALCYDSDGREVAFEDSVCAMHHIRGSQKDEIQDNKLGKTVFKFKKHIPNHFFHAGNYAATAAALLAKAERSFSGGIPVFGNFFRGEA